ncbi:MAG: hypothetical protein AAGI30_12410 [Planctomycetota bacterium]
MPFLPEHCNRDSHRKTTDRWCDLFIFDAEGRMVRDVLRTSWCDLSQGGMGMYVDDAVPVGGLVGVRIIDRGNRPSSTILFGTIQHATPCTDDSRVLLGVALVKRPGSIDEQSLEKATRIGVQPEAIDRRGLDTETGEPERHAA